MQRLVFVYKTRYTHNNQNIKIINSTSNTFTGEKQIHLCKKNKLKIKKVATGFNRHSKLPSKREESVSAEDKTYKYFL